MDNDYGPGWRFAAHSIATAMTSLRFGLFGVVIGYTGLNVLFVLAWAIAITGRDISNGADRLYEQAQASLNMNRTKCLALYACVSVSLYGLINLAGYWIGSMLA